MYVNNLVDLNAAKREIQIAVSRKMISCERAIVATGTRYCLLYSVPCTVYQLHSDECTLYNIAHAFGSILSIGYSFPLHKIDYPFDWNSLRCQSNDTTSNLMHIHFSSAFSE